MDRVLKVNNNVCSLLLQSHKREAARANAISLGFFFYCVVTAVSHDNPRGQCEVQHRCSQAKVRFVVLRGQLEMLEDKLRELRLLALDPREYDDRTVTLSQLDSLRRELIGTAKNNLKYVDFSKVRFTVHSASI